MCLPLCMEKGVPIAYNAQNSNERTVWGQFLEPNNMWRMLETLTKYYFGVNDGVLYFGLISQSDFHMFNLHDSFSDISKDNLCRE